MKIFWEDSDYIIEKRNKKFLKEANLLKLNCDKALHLLNWQATLDFKETTTWTAEWYLNYYTNGPESALDFTIQQINEYMRLADQRGTLKIN